MTADDQQKNQDKISTSPTGAASCTPMELLLGKQLFTKQQPPPKSSSNSSSSSSQQDDSSSSSSFVSQPTRELLQDKDFVLLYFSAAWCPPCQAFTPILIDFYKQQHDATTGKFEIVYISSDRSVEEFTSYYHKMPWLAVPTTTATDATTTTTTTTNTTNIRSTLASRLKIQGIPSLVVLQVSTGLFVTADARTQIITQSKSSKSSMNNNAKTILEDWKSKPGVSLEEGAAAAAAGGGFSLGSFLTFIAKNPVFLLGTYYLIKMALRYLKKKQLGGSDSSTAGDALLQNEGNAGDSEF